jgi:hypothetical protein
MRDVAGGVTPDIVLRSRVSGQNRIYVEVKDSEPLHYDIEDSQIVRYFLHLLGTTTKVSEKGAVDKHGITFWNISPDWQRHST